MQIEKSVGFTRHTRLLQIARRCIRRLLSDALGLMLRRPFFFSTLLGQMMSDNATTDGAGDGVMPRVVARNAAHDGTLQTAGRVRGFD